MNMNIFEEAIANRQSLTITQENLPEFKEWLNSPQEPSGYFNFSIDEEVRFADIIPDNCYDKKKIETISHLILRSLHNDDRMKECFDLASIAPQIPTTVYYLAGIDSGNFSFYKRLGKTIKERKMQDNIALVANNIYDISEYDLPGQPEDIRTLPQEKRRDLDNILQVYTRSDYGSRNLGNEQGVYNKIRFASAIFSRGDLLNYDGLSNEQRKQTVTQYIQALPNRPRYVGEADTRISETLARLDEKYLTVDLLKAVMMRTEKAWDDNRRQNVERKTLKTYTNIEFELSEQDKRNYISAAYRPTFSSEYAKKDTSKAKTQAEKNVNIIPEDYKRIRDFLIKESQNRNKNSANAGFQNICCELFGVKSFAEIPEGSIIGILADVNLKTAQHDVINGNAKNLSPQAMQQVLDTDKNGYYARKISTQDIEAINRYSDKAKVQPGLKTKAIMERGKILKAEKYVLQYFTSSYNTGLTGKEKQAILARSEVAFKADTIYFRLEMEGQNFENSCAKSREFAIIASDAVQQKKDFTPEQKAVLKKLTGQDYSAQDVLNILNMRYEEEKQLAQQRIETYKKVEAVKDIVYRENKDKTTVAEKIKKLQEAYQEIQNCSKNKNFEARDEEAYKPENVEHLIAARIAKCISSGYTYETDRLSGIEKPSFMASMFAPRKEEQRQNLNSAIRNFNSALTDLTRNSDWNELKQYEGKILSSETREQSQKKADNAKQTSQIVNDLLEEFFRYNGHDNQQAPIAEKIFAASPQPIEKLEMKNYINDNYGQAQIEKLGRMAEGEKLFSTAYERMEHTRRAKKHDKETLLVQEATKQKALQSQKIQARTRTAREKLRAKAGNVTLLEKIDAGIKAKEEKQANEPQTFDKLAIKEALKSRRLE